jgi:DNA polymerase III alpha subunit
MISVTVSSKEFQTFISSILNVDRSGVSLKLFPSFIEALVLSEDNSSIILYTKLNILTINGLDEEMVIHIKDLTKFQKLLDMNNGETFTFSIRDNHIYFENDMVKGAKFMLADRPSKTVNARVNVQWFNSFEKTSRMKISKPVVKSIIQCSSFTSDDANKVYVYQDGNKVVAEINDRTKNNLDNMSIYIGEIEDGQMEGKVILNVSTLSRLFLADEMTLETSFIGQGVSRTEIVFLSFTNDNVSVRYLLNTLRS